VLLFGAGPRAVCAETAAAPADASPGDASALAAQPPVASGPRRMEVPVEHLAESVTVVGRAEIERRQWRTLRELLAEVPGLHAVQSGGVGRSTAVFVRGTESNHVQVLLDGIELGDPSLPGGVFNASDLLLDNLERVEIVRGPSSTLYGSDSIGGVINLVTRRGRGDLQVSGALEYGAFNSFQQSLGLHGGSEAIDYSIGFTNLHSRGISARDEDRGGHERDGTDNRSLSTRVGIRAASGVELGLVGRFADLDGEYDASGDDRDARDHSRELFWRGEVALPLARGRVRPRAGLSYADHDRKTASDPAAVDTFDGRRLKLDLQTDVEVASGQWLTLGYETERESVNARSFQRTHQSVRTRAGFAQQQLAVSDRLYATVGARVDEHEQFGSQLTYRAALAYLSPALGTKLHASFGTGFKSPTVEDLFGRTPPGAPFPFRGNPDLEPERSRGWDAGVEQPLFGGRLRLGVTYFQNRIRDLITTAPTFDTLINVERARTDGFETFLELRPWESIRARIDHTYTMSENADTGEDLLRRPSHKLTGKLEALLPGRATLSVAATCVGERKDFDADSFEVGTFSAYTRVDLAATLPLSDRTELFARIENLFDRDYDDPDGFNAPGFAGFVGARGRF
jgi:vitamin B12 transporter